MNYEKVIIALLEHFIANEGTDCLGDRSEVPEIADISLEERRELARLRDVARKNMGWQGY